MAGLLNLIIKSLLGEQIEAAASIQDQLIQPSQYAPRRVKNSRNVRIENEVYMIAPRFGHNGGILYDDINKNWLIIPKYPLPERWKQRWCKLMIVFPNTYPETPPIGFYLNQRFHLKSGERDSHFTGNAYHGALDLTEQGWFWYCVTVDTENEGKWQSTADYRQPDNLWTFLNMVRESLTSDF